MFLIIFNSSLFLVSAQPNGSDNLPILLIHGYGETDDIWNMWIEWLYEDNFLDIYPITFTNDRCGSSEQHAYELENKVDTILNETGKEKVNIITHSKGGLDARWYISYSSIDKVANLIMIGTPNAGSPSAWLDLTGCPFGSDFDLFPGSAATNVSDRPESTNYYTIAGNWMPENRCPIGWLWIVDGGSCFIPGPDDKLVPVYSVNSSTDYIPLASPLPYDHFELINQKEVYDLTVPILESEN